MPPTGAAFQIERKAEENVGDDVLPARLSVTGEQAVETPWILGFGEAVQGRSTTVAEFGWADRAAQLTWVTAIGAAADRVAANETGSWTGPAPAPFWLRAGHCRLTRPRHLNRA
jgi:hypothetical protein